MARASTILRDSDNWGKYSYLVQMGEDFRSYKEVLTYVLSDGLNDPTISKEVKSLLDDSNNGALPPEAAARFNPNDTSLGGNDAINCYPQFCEDDDIVHPMTSSDGYGIKGMGQEYSEVYDQQQQILHMSFGVPEFSNLVDFYRECVNEGMSSLMNSGEVSGAYKIGKILSSGLRLAVEIPLMPIRWVDKKLDTITRQQATQFVDFKATMPLYYRMVNSMLAHLAVNMGIIPNGSGNRGETYNPQSSEGANYQILQNENNPDDPYFGAPEAIREEGLDIYRIITKRARRISSEVSTEHRTSDDILEAMQGTTKEGALNAFCNSFNSSMLEAAEFVGFRIDNTVDSSESISNSTGESQLASMLNEKASKANDVSFSAGAGEGSGFISGAYETVVGGIKDFVNGISDTFSVSGLTSTLAGSSFIDIPEMWKGSSFDKSYNFRMQLRAPYGDPVSVYQCVYVPLVMLFCGACPRATGKNAYTSPFLVRAYCKGKFAIPLGIIDSMSITRGSDEYGWTRRGLPTCVDVSFSIKDLSPALYISLADPGFLDVFAANTAMQEYLLTLSGVSARDRLSSFRRIKRKAQIVSTIMSKTKLNPYYYGFEVGNSAAGRVMAAAMPGTRLPD